MSPSDVPDLPLDVPLERPAVDPPPSSVQPVRIVRVCEACECRITESGETLTVSDKWRKVLRQELTIEKLREEIAGLKEELRVARAAIPAEKKRQGLLS